MMASMLEGKLLLCGLCAMIAVAAAVGLLSVLG
jgi:hypothetical protein